MYCVLMLKQKATVTKFGQKKSWRYLENNYTKENF